MSIPVAAVGAAQHGWQVSSLLTTPLGSAYVPRAQDIEASLLAGRLQRMEDTTKIYKGLVRQGLGWAKVFQRVQYLTRFDFAEYFLETRERELSVAMYEAAAKDFLSKFADGDVIKLRLLQSNEFRECLEKYGAALNAGVCRNFSLAYGECHVVFQRVVQRFILASAGTYAYHTRTGVFELALPDTPQPATMVEDTDDKRQLKRQYRVCMNRPRLCVNNYGSLPSAAEAQELLTHAKRRSHNRRRGQRTEEEAQQGAGAPVGGVKRPRKPQRASAPSPAAVSAEGAAGGGNAGYGNATYLTAMQLQQLAQLQALQQLAQAHAHAQAQAQAQGGGSWEAVQEAMRGGLAQPAVWGGMPVTAASSSGTSTAGSATPAVAWPAASGAAQQWPQMAYVQAVAQLQQGASAAMQGWQGGDAAARSTSAAADTTAFPVSSAAASSAGGGNGTFGPPSTPSRPSKVPLVGDTPGSLPPMHSPGDEADVGGSPPPRPTTKRAQAAAAKKAAAAAAAAKIAQQRSADKAAKAAQREKAKAQAAAETAASSSAVWPAAGATSAAAPAAIPVAGVVAAQADQAQAMHPALAAQWMAAAAAQVHSMNPMYYALAAQHAGVTDASVTADSSSWPGLSVSGVFAGMPVAQAAVPVTKKADASTETQN